MLKVSRDETATSDQGCVHGGSWGLVKTQAACICFGVVVYWVAAGGLTVR